MKIIFGQIFLTDANLHRVPDLFKDENVPLKKFKVELGAVEEMKA